MKKFLSLFFPKYKQPLETGQALLVIVLVMVVALTVGLSVAVRTITNLRISSESESSERAFSAAEAGIEQSLVSNSSIPATSLSDRSSYQTTISSVSGSSFSLNNGATVLKDEPADIWLSTHPTYANPWSGDLGINWGKQGEVCDSNEANNTMAALEIVLISGTKANPKATSYLLDPCNTRSQINKFDYVSTPGETIDGNTYAYKYTISINSGLIARIIPLYSSSVIAVQKDAASPDLPSQGTVITSTGTADNTTRKIITLREHPRLPSELFPFIFFSP